MLDGNTKDAFLQWISHLKQLSNELRKKFTSYEYDTAQPYMTQHSD